MPGGRGKSGKPRIPEGCSSINDKVFCYRRPGMVPYWMNAREDGCFEFTGLVKTWPDLKGRVRKWYTILVYLDEYYKDVMIKRFEPDDYESFAAELTGLPSVLTPDWLERRGFGVN